MAKKEARGPNKGGGKKRRERREASVWGGPMMGGPGDDGTEWDGPMMNQGPIGHRQAASDSERSVTTVYRRGMFAKGSGGLMTARREAAKKVAKKAAKTRTQAARTVRTVIAKAKKSVAKKKAAKTAYRRVLVAPIKKPKSKVVRKARKRA